MKLTKKERNKYYKRAIRRVKKGKHYERFICIALRNIVNDDKDGYFISSSEIPVIFKEFGKRITKMGECWISGRWWPEEDIKSRVKVLNQCIKETNPKTK
jgi:hypothetical protein